MTAERLLDAAEVLRERAKGAAGGGPLKSRWGVDWIATNHDGVTPGRIERAMVSCCAWDVAVFDGSGVGPEDDESDSDWGRRRGVAAKADADYVAMMDPVVGLAVADMLEAEVVWPTRYSWWQRKTAKRSKALAVADAILRTKEKR